jgi:hypothetical protein
MPGKHRRTISIHNFEVTLWHQESWALPTFQPAARTLICNIAVSQAINVRFANRNAVQVRVRLSIGTGANPATTDYVDYDVAIQPYGVLEIPVSPCLLEKIVGAQ